MAGQRTQESTQLAINYSESHQGPLPDPNTLAKYEQACPGAADRIITRFEKEADHRHAFENQMIQFGAADAERDRREAMLGQVFAFVIGMTAIIVGGITSVCGAEWAGSFIGGGGVIGLVTVFIKGRRPRKEEQPSAAESNT